MTIVVGVATPEGLVLASDSRTTTTFDGDRTRIASDNAQKLFDVKGMGIATYGMAFIARDTIAGVMDQFAAHVEGSSIASAPALAQALGEFFDGRLKAWLAELDEDWDTEELGFPLGFLVAGYGEDGVGTIVEVLIPTGEVSELATTNVGGMMWRGQTDVIRRLIKGIDWPCVGELDVDLSAEQIEKLHQLEYADLPPITLQDGIDYASFLVRTTIDMQRFSDGTLSSPGEVPGCGGPLQVLAIERSRHVWVRPLTLHGPSSPGLAEGTSS